MLIRLTEDEGKRLDAMRERMGARSCTEVVRALIEFDEGDKDDLRMLIVLLRVGRSRLAKVA